MVKQMGAKKLQIRLTKGTNFNSTAYTCDCGETRRVEQCTRSPRRYDDLNPDGIKVIVDRVEVTWCVGASVFIPCINTTRAGGTG